MSFIAFSLAAFCCDHGMAADTTSSRTPASTAESAMLASWDCDFVSLAKSSMPPPAMVMGTSVRAKIRLKFARVSRRNDLIPAAPFTAIAIAMITLPISQ